MIACASKYFASHHESYQGYRELRLSFESLSDMCAVILMCGAILVEARGAPIGVLPFRRRHAGHTFYSAGEGAGRRPVPRARGRVRHPEPRRGDVFRARRGRDPDLGAALRATDDRGCLRDPVRGVRRRSRAAAARSRGTAGPAGDAQADRDRASAARMSGIAGVIRFDGAPVESGLVERMTGAMSHRGPDGVQHRVSGSVALGHCMLRTTAESLEEHQPLGNEDGTVVLVMDGRVDNWEELRRDLIDRGAVLRTRADAELVLRAYETWGADCLSHLEGDFALVIWDERRREALCARDRAGKKTFTYHWDGKTLAFASELHAILALPWVHAPLNEGLLAEVLADDWRSLDETFWEGVLRLPAAHRMTVSARGVRGERRPRFLRDLRGRRAPAPSPGTSRPGPLRLLPRVRGRRAGRGAGVQPGGGGASRRSHRGIRGNVAADGVVPGLGAPIPRASGVPERHHVPGAAAGGARGRRAGAAVGTWRRCMAGHDLAGRLLFGGPRRGALARSPRLVRCRSRGARTSPGGVAAPPVRRSEFVARGDQGRAAGREVAGDHEAP